MKCGAVITRFYSPGGESCERALAVLLAPRKRPTAGPGARGSIDGQTKEAADVGSVSRK